METSELASSQAAPASERTFGVAVQEEAAQEEEKGRIVGLLVTVRLLGPGVMPIAKKGRQCFVDARVFWSGSFKLRLTHCTADPRLPRDAARPPAKGISELRLAAGASAQGSGTCTNRQRIVRTSHTLSQGRRTCTDSRASSAVPYTYNYFPNSPQGCSMRRANSKRPKCRGALCGFCTSSTFVSLF